MPDETLPAGTPHPMTPKFTQAFGFSIDEETAVASMTQQVDQSRQVADALRAKIADSMLHDVAGSAVFADSLKNRILGSMQGQIDQSREALGKLQQPIFSSIVNDLGATLEATQHMGVVIPQPGQEAPCPPCVVIRSNALSGDLGPALECYRATALPLRDARGMEYARAVDYIIKCLPADEAIQDSFALAISRIQNEPFANVAPMAFSATVPGSGPPLEATSLPEGAPVSSGVISAAGPGSGGVPQYAFPQSTQFIPGSGAGPATANILPAVGEVGSGAPPIAAPGGTYFGPAIGSGAPPQTGIATPPGYIPGSGAPPVSPGPVPSPTPPGPGGVIYQPPGGVPPGYIPGSGPPPGYTPPPPEFQPPTPLPAKPPPGSTYRPETPAKPPPPPAPCVKICPPDKPPPCDYQLVCSSDHLLYVIGPDDKPRSTFDRVIAKGDPTGWNLQQAIDSCLIPKPTQPPPPPPEGGGLPGIVQDVGCDGLFRFQSLAQMLPAGFFTELFKDASGALAPIEGCGAQLICDILTGARNGLIEIAGPILDSIIKAGTGNGFINCSGSASEAAIIGARILTGLVSKYLTGAATPADTSLEYAQNSLCPYLILNSTQATTAFLGDTISAEVLRCLVEANGNKWDQWAKFTDANRRKLDPFQYATLYRRELIPQQVYERKLRETGITRSDDVDNLYRLTEQIPAPTDIVRLMVRDAADTINIDWSKEDALFPQKYKGDLAKWGRMQGVSDNFMQMYWRAHFGIPAPGQLAVMLHRLSRLPPGDPAFVDLATIRNALIQQDISPKWVDQFVAISFNPLTRIDARRAYEVGALGVDDLKEAYLNLGYDNANADRLVRFNTLNVRRAYMRRSEVQQLAKGEISDADFDAALTQWGADDQAIQQARERAAILRRVDANKHCLRAFHKRFIRGDFDSTTAITLIQTRGQSLQNATTIVNGWECEVAAQGKEFSFSLLNQLYEQGLISELDYVRRARNLGYDQDDAVTLLRLIQRKLNIKMLNQQARDLKAEQAAQEKLARQLLRQANRDEAARRKQAANLAKARTMQELRNRRVIAAGVKFAEHSGQEVPDAIIAIRQVYQNALGAYPVTNDEVIGALTIITGDSDLKTLPEVIEALATALTTQASLDSGQSLSGASPLPTNGHAPMTR